MIRKLLIANRGEIACRIMRTCRAMGVATAAVFSAADAGARHVRQAGEALYLGPGPAAESYLNIEAVLEAARRSGADAVHPGFGFLAEDAAFARACLEAGLVFVGPPPEVIEHMGHKRQARRLMAGAGLPVLPGWAEPPRAGQSEAGADARLLAAAEKLGFPLLVKPAAGGGGKGMRVVASLEALAEALPAARRQARAAFGNDELLLERALDRPRHVEFQIFGDAHGNLIHLGERECSIQRRHQKIIEETPSTALTPDLRRRMAEAALTAGRALRYANAGTVEFLLDGQDFYFLEVNTRLQVEHAVTEMVTGLDLVRWQLLVAEGRPLPLGQAEVRFEGHAIECRLYAEDPAAGFLPAAGRVLLWREAGGEGLRTDAGIDTGDVVSPFYDPMLAKIIAHGRDRAEALRRMHHALGRTTLLGLANNLDFLRAAVLHPAHLAGDLSTQFIPDHLPPESLPGPENEGDTLAVALIGAGLRRFLAGRDRRPPHLAGPWSNSPDRPPRYRFAPAGTGPVDLRLRPDGRNGYRVELSGGLAGSHRVELGEVDGPDLALTVDGHRRRLALAVDADGTWWVKVGERALVLPAVSSLPEPDPAARAGGSLRAPLPGRVVKVHVRQGQPVQAGDTLVTLEAMKMEHAIKAAAGGVVAAIHYGQGEVVEAEAVLVEVVA
ncbi:MAG: acetyl/propionyl/methylcrotonyl-CoA carboxylase subunit alpha, partial [Anaerolineae bacterium]